MTEREGQDLRDLDAAIRTARGELVNAVVARRRDGWSWQRIGDALGVSRQAAWERFHRDVAHAEAWQS